MVLGPAVRCAVRSLACVHPMLAAWRGISKCPPPWGKHWPSLSSPPEFRAALC